MKRKLCIYLCLMVITPFVASACAEVMYPTLANVKEMGETEKDFQKDLQAATVDVMTEQHAAMSPEVAEALKGMQVQYTALADKYRASAAEKDAAVQGPALGNFGTGGLQGMFNLLGLGWLWPLLNGFFGKSRASKEITDLKLSLATAASTGEVLPSGNIE